MIYFITRKIFSMSRKRKESSLFYIKRHRHKVKRGAFYGDKQVEVYESNMSNLRKK